MIATPSELDLDIKALGTLIATDIGAGIGAEIGQWVASSKNDKKIQ